jgi:hypothetical protein
MFKQPTSSIGFYTIAGLSLAGYILLGYSTDRMNFPQLIYLFNESQFKRGIYQTRYSAVGFISAFFGFHDSKSFG